MGILVVRLISSMIVLILMIWICWDVILIIFIWDTFHLHLFILNRLRNSMLLKHVYVNLMIPRLRPWLYIECSLRNHLLIYCIIVPLVSVDIVCSLSRTWYSLIKLLFSLQSCLFLSLWTHLSWSSLSWRS